VEQVQREYHLPAGDFPDVEHFKEVLGGYSIDKFREAKAQDGADGGRHARVRHPGTPQELQEPVRVN
jgi:hypothetical protein